MKCDVPLERVSLKRNSAFAYPNKSKAERDELFAQDVVKELLGGLLIFFRGVLVHRKVQEAHGQACILLTLHTHIDRQYAISSSATS